MKEPIKLYESLFILHKCSNVIQRVIERTRKIENGEMILVADRDFLVDNATLIILQLAIFQEEYNGHFTQVESEYKKRVLEFREILSPVIDLLNKWSEIRKFRSLFIAHNCRAKGTGQFYPPDITQYRVPSTTFDFHLVSDYMNYIMQLMNQEFKAEMKGMVAYITGLAPKARRKHDISNLNPQLVQMQNEVNKRCEKYGKPYRLEHISQYAPPTTP
jgi:hypothetical protein